MEKKIYMSPLTEVARINMSSAILTGSPTDSNWSMGSNPGHPGAPGRKMPVLGNDSVPVF